MKSRKKLLLNLKFEERSSPYVVNHKTIETHNPIIIVYDVSCPIAGLYFSLAAATMKKNNIIKMKVT